MNNHNTEDIDLFKELRSLSKEEAERKLQKLKEIMTEGSFNAMLKDYYKINDHSNEWNVIWNKGSGLDGIYSGLEEFNIIRMVAEFEKDNNIIAQFRVKSDHSYFFAISDINETDWKVITSIPESVMRNANYLEEPIYLCPQEIFLSGL